MLCQKSLHESCRMGRRIVVMKLNCSLGNCECYGQTEHKLSQRRLTTDWLDPRESNCSRIQSKVSSDWLPSYIKATRPVLEIFKMASYFPDSPRTWGSCCGNNPRIYFIRHILSLFTSKLDLNLRKKLIKCYIWSMALYGAETWTLRAADQKYLESLKCGAGEGWRRSVGPIMWEMKKCYLESMSRGISYMK